MSITESFAGVAVADYESMRAWYERLFGRAPDLVPNETEAAWRLTEGGWIYIVADSDRAGHAVITLLVDDLDAHLAELAERRIEAGPVDAIPGAVRKATVTDPEGNRITFGEPL